MDNNEFLRLSLQKVSVQAHRHYGRKNELDQISAVTQHLDEGCPALRVEFETFSRVDEWEWKKARDAKGKIIPGRDEDPHTQDPIGYNKWHFVGSSDLYEEDKEQEAPTEQELAHV